MAWGDILFRGTALWKRLAAGTNGQVLTTHGAGADPTWETPSSGSGTVTNTGTLTDHALIVGNGGVDVSALGSLGTTTTLLHGNASGDPTFGAVVTGDITNANVTLAKIANAAANDKLLGSGNSGSGASYAEISLGTGLAMSGTTLSATGAADFVKIEEQTPSSTGTLTFSSLGSYTHLEIRWSARGDQSATSTNLAIQFNADTGSNYDRQSLFASASSPSGGESLAQTSAAVGSVVAATGTASAAGSGVISIMDYRGTTFHKSGVSANALPRTTATANFFDQHFSFRWRSTSAITSITLTLASGNFVAGSKFTLYGLA